MKNDVIRKTRELQWGYCHGWGGIWHVSVQLSKQNQKYITYCNSARRGLSHVQRAQKFGHVVFELCRPKWTDRQTDRQTYTHTHHSTLHPSTCTLLCTCTLHFLFLHFSFFNYVSSYYRTVHYSAKRSLAITSLLSVCLFVRLWRWWIMTT